MSRTRALSIAAVGTALSLLCCAPAQAQSYPERPVTLVVPYPPGGASDMVARIIAPSLSSQLKQEVVVVNRGGAGGAIGTTAVGNAAPDGYTLLLGTSMPLTVAPVLSRVAYDPQTSFAPIASLSRNPGVLVVNTRLPKSCPELVQQAHDNPGKFHYSSTGNGSQSHLDGEAFKLRARIDIRHVPFRDVGASLANVIGGQVEMTFQSLGAVLPHVASQALRPLAVTSDTPNPKLPGVPTMKDCGFPGFLSNWAALLAPAKTPEPIVAKLNEATNAALRNPEVIKRMTDLGLEPLGGTASALAERIAVETKEWAAVARAAQIKLD